MHPIKHSSNINYHHPEKTLPEKTAFTQLVAESQAAIQKFLNDPLLQQLYKNKSVVMLFLDKTRAFKGWKHADAEVVSKFGWGSHAWASMELMRYAEQLVENPNLTRSEKTAIKHWLTSERECLPYAYILDAWCAKSEKILNIVNTKSDPSIDELSSIEPVLIPSSELNLFSMTIADHLKRMPPGCVFKMPAGSLIHATRLSVEKSLDGTYELRHYNTGEGAIKIDANEQTTACKYSSINSEILENSDFWRQVLEAKLQPKMDALNLVLEGLKIVPQDLDERVKKPLQDLASCSFHAAEAEFKHMFISQFETIDQGWQAYKKCTSLMASIAAVSNTSIDSDLKKLVIEKERIRHRYLDWLSITHIPEKFKKTQDAYIEAICSCGLDSKESILDMISFQAPLRILSLLDKRLNKRLESLKFKQLKEVREKYGSHLGLKPMLWLESVRSFLAKILESNSKRQTLDIFKVAAEALIPNNELFKSFSYPIMNQSDLEIFLGPYIEREDPVISNQILQEFLANGLISETFITDLDDHIISKKAEIEAKNQSLQAIDLVKKIKNPTIRYRSMDATMALLCKNFEKQWCDLITQFDKEDQLEALKGLLAELSPDYLNEVIDWIEQNEEIENKERAFEGLFYRQERCGEHSYLTHVIRIKHFEFIFAFLKRVSFSNQAKSTEYIANMLEDPAMALNAKFSQLTSELDEKRRTDFYSIILNALCRSMIPCDMPYTKKCMNLCIQLINSWKTENFHNILRQEALLLKIESNIKKIDLNLTAEFTEKVYREPLLTWSSHKTLEFIQNIEEFKNQKEFIHHFIQYFCQFHNKFGFAVGFIKEIKNKAFKEVAITQLLREVASGSLDTERMEYLNDYIAFIDECEVQSQSLVIALPSFCSFIADVDPSKINLARDLLLKIQDEERRNHYLGNFDSKYGLKG